MLSPPSTFSTAHSRCHRLVDRLMRYTRMAVSFLQPTPGGFTREPGRQEEEKARAHAGALNAHRGAGDDDCTSPAIVRTGTTAGQFSDVWQYTSSPTRRNGDPPMLEKGSLGVESLSTTVVIDDRGLDVPAVRGLTPVAPLDDEDIVTPERVAKVVAGVSTIGAARTALEQVGWIATIAGNRITVNAEVVAQFTPSTAAPLVGDGWWVVYRAGGRPPVWIVGAGGSAEAGTFGGERVSAESAGAALQGRCIAVVGLGYVGLPTALSFADEGAEIIGCDVSESRLAEIKSERVDQLDRDRERLKRHLQGKLIKLTTEPSATSSAQAVVVCVPTPIDAHQTPDLTALAEACASVVLHAVIGQTIVLTSTTYVGCTRELLVQPLQARGFEIGRDIFVAFSPERIDPGVEAHAPDSTPRVVGGVTDACTARATEVLRHTASTMHTVSSPEAAEMTKLLENTFRAVNIALANEFSDAARELSVDVVEVIQAAATKPYGFMPFYPGPGVGGHCIPCDPHYLLWQLRALRASSPLVSAAMTAIAARPGEVVGHARRILGDQGRPISGARILLAGVSYKPGVGDVRESPAIPIIDMLVSQGAHVGYTDSYIDIIQTASGSLSHLPYPGDHNWDLVVVHTVHPNENYDWLAGQRAVLDTTYRLTDLPERHVP